MRPLPIGAPVKVIGGAPWARDATGIVTLDLDNGYYLVTFDEPRDDGSGDGPYSGAPFHRAELDTDLT